MEKLNLDPAAASWTPSIDNSQRQASRKSLILRCQRILFSAYRTDQYADPDGFLTSLGVVLEQYPDEVVIHVTDPRTGAQRGLKFPPTIAEIVSACDAKMADIERTKRYQNWGKNEAPMIEPPRQDRPSYDELKAKYGNNWGINPMPDAAPKPTFKAPTLDELVQHYRTNPEAVARLKGETDWVNPETGQTDLLND